VLVYLAIAAGGALGALARYGLGELARVWRALPGWGAIIVANLLGCLLIGLGSKLLPGAAELARGALLLGFCGALTTFSSFSLDNVLLFHERKLGALAANLTVSLGAGLLAVWVGLGV
jgi:CrcB protein